MLPHLLHKLLWLRHLLRLPCQGRLRSAGLQVQLRLGGVVPGAHTVTQSFGLMEGRHGLPLHSATSSVVGH